MASFDLSESSEGQLDMEMKSSGMAGICCVKVKKQCQAAHISGSVRLMNHLDPRQTLNSEDKTSETLSRVIPLPKACRESQMRTFPEQESSMDAGGRPKMLLESKPEPVNSDTIPVFLHK